MVDRRRRVLIHLIGAVFLFLGASGCAVRKMAINMIGDALASSGTTFASDDDPELVKQALPFSLKLMESLLAETPNHRGLLFATSSAFTQYAYAFVREEADEMEPVNLQAALEMKGRAKRLFLHFPRGITAYAAWKPGSRRSEPRSGRTP